MVTQKKKEKIIKEYDDKYYKYKINKEELKEEKESFFVILLKDILVTLLVIYLFYHIVNIFISFVKEIEATLMFGILIGFGFGFWFALRFRNKK